MHTKCTCFIYYCFGYVATAYIYCCLPASIRIIVSSKCITSLSGKETEP